MMTAASIWSYASGLPWGDLGTWAGTGVAGLSLMGSWLQARKARGFATDAERIRDEMRGEIATRNAQSELSMLKVAADAALRVMDKYGAGAGKETRRGTEPEKDAAAVRELTTQMAQNKTMLIQKFGTEIEIAKTRITDLLTEFGNAKSDGGRAAKGQVIHSELAELSGNIKNALDGTIYG